MRADFLFLLIVLLIVSTVGFMGCSDGSTIEDLYIVGMEVSISEDRPARVTVTVIGFHPDSGAGLHEIHHQREGDTIYISGTKRVSGPGGGDVATVVEDIHGQISLGEFGVGEYKVIADDLELVFHIEHDESWIIRSPLIESIDFSVSESVPAQVIVDVEGYFCEAAIPFIKTHQKQEGNTIYIQMTSKVRSSISCPSVVSIDFFKGRLVKHQKQISIGEFMTGHYEVVVNDIEKSFFVQ